MVEERNRRVWTLVARDNFIAVQDRVNDAGLQPSLGDTNDVRLVGGNVVVQLRELKRVVHELDVDVEDGETGSRVRG